MSAATIDRRLRPFKASSLRHGRRRQSSLEAHRRELPLKIDTWPAKGPECPGYIEIDTAAHCGGSMTGSFVWTLTTTDVFTQWTELRSVWNRGGGVVCNALAGSMMALPFKALYLNSDNGGEVINGHIKRYFAKYLPEVIRTRSRSYRKNDNAHVEQKNGAVVRTLYGHGRIDDMSLLPLMNEINRLQCLLKNLYTPTMRLLSKERIGSKWVKCFEKVPKTPAQRVLESPFVTERERNGIMTMLAQTDFIDVAKELQKKVRELAKKLASPAGEASAGTPRRSPGATGPVPAPPNTRGRVSLHL